MQPIVNVPPTEWPKVTVGGKPYLLRYTKASLLLLSDWGVPVGNSVKYQEAMQRSNFAMNVKGALALLGNFDATGDWEPLDQHPARTMGKLIDGELETIIAASSVAMEKVVPPATPSPAPEAKSEGTEEKVN